MHSLYRQENLQNAGIALLALGFAIGAVLGKLAEGAICTHEPSVSWIMVAGGAFAAMILDLVYRHRFREAAAAWGWKRFVHPLQGGRVAFVPAWMIGAAVLAWAVVSGFSDGFC